MLTLKELALQCPSAMATKPAAHCSPRYSMLPTIDAIKALEEDGYQIVSARQDNVRPDKWKRELHARHKVTMRHVSAKGLSQRAKLLNAVPEILITNSSDGSCPLQMDLGVFRQVCSNGLIVMQSIEAFSFIHKQVTAEQVVQRAAALSKTSKPLFDKIALWSTVRMNPLAVQRFAEKALEVRMGPLADKYDALSIVQSRRPEDEEPTLWNVFNRAQENGMLGAVTGSVAIGKAGERRALHARPLSGISADNDFNRALWLMTEEFAAKAGVK